MVNVVLTFWLCVAGTSCPAEDAIPGSLQTVEGSHSVRHCEADWADMLNALPPPPGYAARHVCEVQGTDL